MSFSIAVLYILCRSQLWVGGIRSAKAGWSNTWSTIVQQRSIKKFTFPFYDRRIVTKRERNSSQTVRIKGDNRSYHRWETFLVSKVWTKIALVASYAGFYDYSMALLYKLFLLIGSQANSFFVRGDRSNYSRKTCGEWQDTKWQLSFDDCYISESVRGFIVLLCGSLLLVSFTRHREWSIIITVRSCLPNKRSRVRSRLGMGWSTLRLIVDWRSIA